MRDPLTYFGFATRAETKVEFRERPGSGIPPDIGARGSRRPHRRADSKPMEERVAVTQDQDAATVSGLIRRLSSTWSTRRQISTHQARIALPRRLAIS